MQVLQPKPVEDKEVVATNPNTGGSGGNGSSNNNGGNDPKITDPTETTEETEEPKIGDCEVLDNCDSLTKHTKKDKFLLMNYSDDEFTEFFVFGTTYKTYTAETDCRDVFRFEYTGFSGIRALTDVQLKDLYFDKDKTSCKVYFDTI